jgi:Flp pilus assembly protein TadD
MDYNWMNIAGIAKNHVGLYGQAVSWFQRPIEANRNYPHTYFVLGVALALIGQLDEARRSVRAGHALIPRSPPALAQHGRR